MSRKINGVFRRLSRAFSTKDERAFDEAMEELEDNIKDAEDPDTIEVHNHIPDSMRDTSMGQLPEKDPPGFDRRGRDASDEEAPPWFKRHAEATDAKFKSMSDAFEEFKKKSEEKEDEGSEDRRHEDRRHDDRHRDEEGNEAHEREAEGEGAMEENLEMDRHRDRRHDDRRHDDEANREILGELEFEAPPGTGDRAKRAKDSAFLSEAFQDAVSKAEVLAPGIAVPAFDQKATPVKTVQSIGKLRRTALDLAYAKPETRGVIDAAMGGRTLDAARMTHGAVRVLFNASASAVAASNNRRATDRTIEMGGGLSTTRNGAIASVSDINKRNREHYARR